jgi:Protein of unknown function (DUF664)
MPFPEPTDPASSRAEVFLRYLAYFRDRLAGKLETLPADELRRSRLPSGWTPLELLKHLRYVELRWLEWGFEGRDFAEPWAEVGQPGERWDGADPATLERVLFHLLQEYARHLGQLDIVVELATGQTGELSCTERAVMHAAGHATASRRDASLPSPRRTGSRTRPGPRSRCAAPGLAAGRPAACGRCPPRPACRSGSGRRAAA